MAGETMKRRDNLLSKIKRVLPTIPQAFWTETNEGKPILTLDGYIYLLTEIGAQITTNAEAQNNLAKGEAYIQINERQWHAVGYAELKDDLPNALAQAQARALIQACRNSIRPYIDALLPNLQQQAKRSLIRTAQILYRQLGAKREERLEHASTVLNRTIHSFNELEPDELATLISELTSTINTPSSQYE
jgi:hypothetical protein